MQREDRLPAGLRCHPHATADSFRHALHHIQPHTPAGDLCYHALRGESRQEQKLEQFRGRELVCDLWGDESERDGPRLEVADVDALAIVGDRDLEHAGPVPRLQQDRAGRRLPRGLPAVRRFDSVIERIADEVGERCLQLFQDVAVDTGLLATHLQSYLFAEGPRNVADQPRKAADAVGEWPHPAGEDLVVQPA